MTLFQEHGSLFRSPENWYRAKPFWAWNGDLDKEELLRQISMFEEMGFGGFFMHSRVGLETEYLSDAWFDCIKSCCNQAEKLGMEAWLYDEDRWPSGTAGGLATMDDRYRQKILKLEIIEPADFKWNAGYLAVFQCKLDEPNISDISKLSNDQDSVSESSKILAFTADVKPGSDFYNGQGYLDVLSPDAVKHFIDVTYEKYADNSGTWFGNVIPGMFTDEPNFNANLFPDKLALEASGLKEYYLPWTSDFPESFKKRFSYDIVDRLPEVCFNVDGLDVNQPRYHFHEHVTTLFVESFSRQIGNWCEKHNLKFTGHVLFENPIQKQAVLVGSAMRFYEHMHIPGIDILSNCHLQSNYLPEYNIPLQCASVVNQFDKEAMISEMYGVIGWQTTFEEFKYISDWQAALGINMRCPHLSWYTMTGQRKRDYPASISYQSPWWKEYKSVEDYFARINLMLSKGKAKKDILVIHPNESFWAGFHAGWENSDTIKMLEEGTQKLAESLLAENICFDYTDEDILSRVGELEDSNLRVGKACYKAVIIPKLLTIRKSTLEFLQKFKDSGGQVFVIGDTLTYLDAKPSDTLRQFVSSCKKIELSRKNILENLGFMRALTIRPKDGRDTKDLLSQIRETDDSVIIFVCNTSDLEAFGVELNYKSSHPVYVEQWNTENGRVESLDAKMNPDSTVVSWDSVIHPYATKLFVLNRKPSACKPVRELTCHQQIKMEDKWQTSLSEPNVLVLDYAKYRLKDENWHEVMEVLKIDLEIRERFGFPPRSARMLQPWYIKHKMPQSDSHPVELVYQFNVSGMVPAGLKLAVEKSCFNKIEINGNVLPPDISSDWWIDRETKLLDIPSGFIKSGINELSLSGCYSILDGIEAIHLIGDFNVDILDGKPIMTDDKIELNLGDWTKQGLPFYSGSVSYSQTVEFDKETYKDKKIYLKVPEFEGVCMNIHVDDCCAGVLAWPPLEIDITDYIKTPSPQITIEVIASRRNTFGPLHFISHSEKPVWIGPNEFVSRNDQWSDEYQLVPYGLLKSPVIEIKEKGGND